MKNMKLTILLSLFLLFLSNIGFGFDLAKNTTISKWRDGKDAAVSITFDDNLLSQFQIAVPEMRKYGFRGTFFVVAQWLDENSLGPLIANHVRELALNGHEIGSHSYSHQYLSKLNEDELLFEVVESKKTIEKYIGKNKCNTFRYPWFNRNEKTDEVLKKHYLWISPLLPTVKSGATDIEKIKNALLNTISEKSWFMSIFHGVEKDFLAISLDDFKEYLKILNEKRAQLWIAPIGEIASYNYLRDNAQIISNEEGIQIVTSAESLDPAIAKTSLTLHTRFPEDWHIIKVIKGLNHKYVKTHTDGDGRFIFYDYSLDDIPIRFEKADVLSIDKLSLKQLAQFDFETESQLDDWNIIEGTWFIQNGMLIGDRRTSEIVCNIENLKDIVIRGRFKIVDDNQKHRSFSFATLFVRTQECLPGENNGIYYALDNHSSISDYRNDHVLLWHQWKTRDGKKQAWGWPDRIVATSPVNIAIDRWHTFEIYLKVKTLMYRLDGLDCLIYDQISIPDGMFGMRSRGSQICFDDISIFEIE